MRDKSRQSIRTQDIRSRRGGAPSQRRGTGARVRLSLLLHRLAKALGSASVSTGDPDAIAQSDGCVKRNLWGLFGDAVASLSFLSLTLFASRVTD